MSECSLSRQFMADVAILRLNEKGHQRLQQLTLRVNPFGNQLRDFLESFVLQKETDVYDPRAGRVTLMTLHAAKGLEFPVVFFVGCEENLLPYQQENKPFDVEQERRLFYVGMTRAQKSLVLTHAQTRFLFGKTYNNEPSRLLNDIENTLKEVEKATSRKQVKEKENTRQFKLF